MHMEHDGRHDNGIACMHAVWIVKTMQISSLRNAISSLQSLVHSFLAKCVSFLDDCSIGEVDRELKEDDRLEVGGVYFLPQPANCSGTLVSWHTCVFYSNLQPGADEYRMSLRVYRQNGSSYRFSNDRTTRVLIFRERNETEICIDMPPDNPIRILEGDRIGLQVDVECAELPRRLVCPLHPNLNRSGVYPVFHLPDFNGMDDIDVSLVENDMYYTDVSINVRASIVGELVYLTHVQVACLVYCCTCIAYYSTENISGC